MSRKIKGFIPIVSITEDVFYPYDCPNYFEGADTLELMIAAWETIVVENPDEIREFNQVGIYDFEKNKIVKVFKFGLTEID